MGIDAPKPINEDSEHYRCGQKAANDLNAIIARRLVSCVDIDERSYDRSWHTTNMAGCPA